MRYTKSSSGLILLAMPYIAFAAPEARRFGMAVPELSVSMMTQFGLGLALIIALIYLLAWVSKKIQGSMKTDIGTMKVIAGLAVGTRERLLLVQVYDQQVLIGVTPGQVSRLHVIDKIPTQKSKVIKNHAEDPPPLSDFLAKLNRQIK